MVSLRRWAKTKPKLVVDQQKLNCLTKQPPKSKNCGSQLPFPHEPLFEALILGRLVCDVDVSFGQQPGAEAVQNVKVVPRENDPEAGLVGLAPLVFYHKFRWILPYNPFEVL